MKCWWVLAGVWVAAGVGGALARIHGLFPRDLDRPDRIVGGEPVKKGDFLWQVSLQKLGRHFCGGTLVAHNLVITAGHCTYETDMSMVRVVTGAWDLKQRSSQRVHRITAVATVPYKPLTMQDDIALLWIQEEERTAAKKDLPRGVPIRLETRREIGTGKKCLISGWGRLSSGGNLPSVLMAADVQLRSDEECSKIFKTYSYFSVFPTNVCAGGGPKDSCQGDSGGPLVCCTDSSDPSTCLLTGVTSWGIGCATKDIPGVYTEVAHYADWIKKTVAKRNGKIGTTGLLFYEEDKADQDVTVQEVD